MGLVLIVDLFVWFNFNIMLPLEIIIFVANCKSWSVREPCIVSSAMAGNEMDHGYAI